MAESGSLENCCPGNGTVGSIPTLSAKLGSPLVGLSGLFGLFGLFGSEDGKNQTNQMNKTNQINQSRLSSSFFPSRLV